MTEIRVLVVQPTGRCITRKVDPLLANLQEIVGGYIQVVDFAGGHAYCDEEGKIKRSLPNRVATILARELGWPPGDILVGTVVFLGDGPDGSESDVPVTVLDTLRELDLR